MRQCGDAHLERDARDPAEDVVHVEYLLRNRFGVPDQQRACRSAHGVEMCPRSWGPSALLTDLCKRMCIPGIKIVGSLLGGISQKADRVKTHDEFIGGVTGAAARLSIEINKRAESFGFTANDRDHQGKPEHSGANE